MSTPAMPPSEPPYPPDLPYTHDSEFTWTQIVLYSSCALSVFNVFFLFTTGNLITWSDDDELSCRPQCGLSIFPRFGMMIVRAIHRAHERVKGRRVESVEVAKKVVLAVAVSTSLALNVTHLRHCTFCKAIWAPRKQFSITLRRLLDEAMTPLRDAAIEAVRDHGENSVEAKLSADLAETMETVCDRAHGAAREMLVHTHGKISVPKITSSVIMAALQVTRLGTTVGLRAEAALAENLRQKLPGQLAGTIVKDVKLNDVVATVWSKLLGRIIASGRLEPVLYRLLNSLIDVKALQPINTLWLRVVALSCLWLLFLLAGAAGMRIFIEESRAGERLVQVAGNFSTTYRILMIVMVIGLVIGQLKLIEHFLKWRAKRIANELTAAMERALLGLVGDAGVLSFVRFLVDTSVVLLIDEIATGTTGGRRPPQSPGDGGGGWLEDGVNALEKALGVDINGDGTIGGKPAAAAGGDKPAAAASGGGAEAEGQGGGFLYDLVARPLRFAYSEFGGTDEVMRRLQKVARADIRPAIVMAFNEPLERSESEAEALLATVKADDFNAGDLQDSAEQSRLDRILLQLNEAIQKRAIEQAARVLQRGVRAKTRQGKFTEKQRPATSNASVAQGSGAGGAVPKGKTKAGGSGSVPTSFVV